MGFHAVKINRLIIPVMGEKLAPEPVDAARKHGLDQAYSLHLSVIHENISWLSFLINSRIHLKWLSRVDLFLPIRQVDVCFLNLSFGVPAAP